MLHQTQTNLRNTMNIKAQKKLALALLEWHGGMSSGLYAVGSCMLSDSEKGVAYSVDRHHGHVAAIHRAVSELRGLKAQANFPDCVKASDERACNRLAGQLEEFIPAPVALPVVSKFVPSLTEAQENVLARLLVETLRLKARKGKVSYAVYDTTAGEKSALGLARVVVNLVDEALSMKGGQSA
jgi:hypothetical protein